MDATLLSATLWFLATGVSMGLGVGLVIVGLSFWDETRPLRSALMPIAGVLVLGVAVPTFVILVKSSPAWSNTPPAISAPASK